MQEIPTYATKRRPASPGGTTLTDRLRAASAKGKAAMREKREQGETMHLAPLGWLNARDKEGRSVLVPDPKTHRLVIKARRMRAQGASIRKVCAAMERDGLRSRRGNVIGPSSMLKVLARTHPRN